MPSQHFLTEITTLVAKIYEIGGFYLDETLLINTAAEVAKDIRERFWMLSLQEITKAFNDGVRFEYGQYKNLSVVTFNTWLRFFMDSGQHHRFVMAVTGGQKQLVEKTEPTEQEIDDLMKQGLQIALETYRSKGMVIDYGNPKYDYLVKTGVLKSDDFQRFKKSAVAELRARLNVMALDRSAETRAEAQRQLQNIDDDPEVDSLAKVQALKNYFDKLNNKK